VHAFQFAIEGKVTVTRAVTVASVPIGASDYSKSGGL
jgi:hypothetical protein